ncbi:MAG: cell envelope biogenesis protein OmpA [Flavobacteriaceae bacterium]|nr:cell envelope biogenesis protein OmpA [Flavobacteriaceae bacterium]|tara:strand:- start:19155 stop:20435 length:1281 start_codon:yes stop_codon:yes gene_type:complete
MKKITTLLAMVFLTTIAFSQEEETEFNQFNKFSIEVSGGFTKPSSPFGDGYRVEGISPYQVSLGVRYMMNEKFGIRGIFNYNSLQEEEGSLPFETSYYRATLEGVANVGNVLDFADWTDRFGLLFHLGGGYSVINHEAPVELDERDTAFNVSAGITPQFRISDRIAFFADVSLIANVGMERSWDGTEVISSFNRRIDDGLLYNVSAGFNIYIGPHGKHADWYSEEKAYEDKLTELSERLEKVETDLIDSDQDGVPDYLDREPNTMSGVAVNTKGIAVDKNENGIPDEIEAGLDARYLKLEDYKTSDDAYGVNVKKLLNDGYVNVYFRFNSDVPETYSLDAINYLTLYMKENPGKNAELIGYADEIGNEAYNQRLSERRANKVRDILVAAGISQSRITVTAGGEDNSVDKSSSGARQLVRRVTFKVN